MKNMSILEKFIFDKLDKYDNLSIFELESFIPTFKMQFGSSPYFKLIYHKISYENDMNKINPKTSPVIGEWLIYLIFEHDQIRRTCRLFIKGKNSAITFIHSEQLPDPTLIKSSYDDYYEIRNFSQICLLKDKNGPFYASKKGAIPFDITCNFYIQDIFKKLDKWDFDTHQKRLNYIGILNYKDMDKILSSLDVSFEFYRNKDLADIWYDNINKVIQNYGSVDDDYTKNALVVLDKIHQQMVNKTYEKPLGNYFKDERAMYIFVLTELSGTKRKQALGITDEIEKSKTLLDSWHQKIGDIIKKTRSIDGDKAIIILDNLYKKLISRLEKNKEQGLSQE